MSLTLKRIFFAGIKEESETSVAGASYTPGAGEAVTHKKKLKEQASVPDFNTYVKEFGNLKLGDIVKNPKIAQNFIQKGKDIEGGTDAGDDEGSIKTGSKVYAMYSIVEDLIEKIETLKKK